MTCLALEASLLRGIDPELCAAILPALNPDREFRYQMRLARHCKMSKTSA